MRILMGVDGSAFAGDTLRAIVAQFTPESTEVLVLHLLQPMGPPPPQMAAGYAPEMEEEKKAARALVESIAEKLRATGFKVSTMVAMADVREGIIDCAAEWRADLIVVGSHGQRGIQRFLLGSVSEFVARHARCSVEIVRTPMHWLTASAMQGRRI